MRTLDEVVEVVSTMFNVKIREEEEGTGGNYRYSEERTSSFSHLFIFQETTRINIFANRTVHGIDLEVVGWNVGNEANLQKFVDALKIVEGVADDYR